MKLEVAVLERIHQSGLAIISKFAKVKLILGQKRKTYLKKIINSSVIIVKSATKVDRELLNSARNLKVVLRAGTGLDNIDIDLLKKKDIKLISVPKANSISTAEFTIMQILMLCRKVPELYPKLQKKDFRRHLFEGRQLSCLKVGIIGLGTIGFEVAKRLKPFGCTIYAYDKKTKNKFQFKKLGGKFTNSIENLISKIDILTLHANLNKKNIHMLGNKEFSKIKKKIFLINCARAELIKNEALVNAINKNKICYASIDTISPEPNYEANNKNFRFKHLLLNQKNIFYTPHIAASTIDAQKKISLELAKKLKKILK